MKQIIASVSFDIFLTLLGTSFFVFLNLIIITARDINFGLPKLTSFLVYFRFN